MNVPYKLDKGDYWHRAKYRALNDPKSSARWLISLAGPPLMVLLALWFPLRANHIALVYVTILFTGLWIASRIHNTRQALLRSGEKMCARKQDRILTIDPNGFWFHNDTLKSWVAWSVLAEIVQNDRHIYFVNTSRRGWIIAKRNFPDEEDAQRFYKMALDYWRAGQNADTSAYFPFGDNIQAGDESKIEVGFHYTLDEYRRFARSYSLYRRIQSGVYWGFMGILSVSIGSALLWGAFDTLKSRDWSGTAYLVFGLFFAGYGANTMWRVSSWAYERAIARTAREDRAIVGPRLVTLTEASHTDWTPYRASRASWRFVKRVEDTPENIILYTPNSMDVVPKSAFESQEKATAFLHMAKTYSDRANRDDDSDDSGKSTAWPPAPKV